MMPDLEVRRVLWRQVTPHDRIREMMAGYLHYMIRGAGYTGHLLVAMEYHGKRGIWALDTKRTR